MPSNLARLIVLLAALSGLAAPPLAAQSADQWFLAEGASNAVLEEEILIANPSSSSVTVTVTLLPDPSAVAPGTELSQAFALGPTSRLTVRVGEAFSGLNGAASARIGRRRLGAAPGLALIDLPSSSPAYASLSFEKKRAAWLALAAYL